MSENRKITVRVPPNPLAGAQKATNRSITETVRKGLEHLDANAAYEGLRKMRGKVKFSINLDELRKDRH